MAEPNEQVMVDRDDMVPFRLVVSNRPEPNPVVRSVTTLIEVASRYVTEHPHAITRVTGTAAKIYLDWKVRMAKRDCDYVEATFDEVVQNLPPSREDGIAAFMCFDRVITKKEALALIKDLSVGNSKFRWCEPDVIQKIHQVLCQKDEEGEVPKNRDPLSLVSLEFFLLGCFRDVFGDCDAEPCEAEVMHAVRMASLHENSIHSHNARMLIKRSEIEENAPSSIPADFVELVRMAKWDLRVWTNYSATAQCEYLDEILRRTDDMLRIPRHHSPDRALRQKTTTRYAGSSVTRKTL